MIQQTGRLVVRAHRVELLAQATSFSFVFALHVNLQRPAQLLLPLHASLFEPESNAIGIPHLGRSITVLALHEFRHKATSAGTSRDRRTDANHRGGMA